MKKHIIKSALIALMGFSVSSCMDETLPTNGQVTENQLDEMAKGYTGLVNAIAGHLGVTEIYVDAEYDFGYPCYSLIRELLCSDMTVYSSGYDYFYYWTECSYLGGNYTTAGVFWNYYYKWAEKCNIIIRKESLDAAENEAHKLDFGIAYFYRAMVYFEMARMYEYKKTGIASLDGQADQYGIYGLTVPIIRENCTEAEARNTPRATFSEIYRFILDDLQKAETYLADCREGDRYGHNVPDISVVYGELARFWLEVGTRFELNPADLSTYQTSGIDLGVSSAQDAYEKAAAYADKAIAYSSSSILTEAKWFDANNGFNSASDWMFGAIITKEQLSAYDWRNYTGHLSPEEYFGVGGITYDGSKYSNAYGAQRTISRALYDQISDNDWRKGSWKAPNSNTTEGYEASRASVPYAHYAVIPDYASFKFRPKGGERQDFMTAAACDFPLMRIEEMYYIKAEALAAARGVAEGIPVLESIVRTRQSDYTCTSGNLSAFRDELMKHKRIEFWGEGLSYWDFKRLNIQVVRGYEGTNVPTAQRLNSIEGYCAPWFTIFITTSECGRNEALIPNPDPSGTVEAWEE
ncbi:MAG: RagB/SusD family nutrient uptake outer membrane protein [Bacteroides sp.]